MSNLRWKTQAYAFQKEIVRALTTAFRKVLIVRTENAWNAEDGFWVRYENKWKRNWDWQHKNLFKARSTAGLCMGILPNPRFLFEYIF